MSTWTYSTLDEESHLVESDPAVLRSRIDQLLEERREGWRVAGSEAADDEDLHIPLDWGLTAAEERCLRTMVLETRKPNSKGFASRDQLHWAVSGMNPETEPQVVSVLVFRIRQKLKTLRIDCSINALRGRGYSAILA